MENLIVEYLRWRDGLPVAERALIDFFVGTVLIRGILGRRVTTAVEQLGGLIKKLLKRIFIRTEQDLAVWIHYRNQAMDEGHTHETPIDCEDGACKLL